jgi:hypothetical protein
VVANVVLALVLAWVGALLVLDDGTAGTVQMIACCYLPVPIAVAYGLVWGLIRLAPGLDHPAVRLSPTWGWALFYAASLWYAVQPASRISCLLGEDVPASATILDYSDSVTFGSGTYVEVRFTVDPADERAVVDAVVARGVAGDRDHPPHPRAPEASETWVRDLSRGDDGMPATLTLSRGDAPGEFFGTCDFPQ